MKGGMKVIIAGGGTGGHLFPAVAVGEQLMRERPETKVLYAGACTGFEARWLPSSGYEYVLFDVHGFRGRGPAARLRATVEFVCAVFAAHHALRSFSAAIVISAGGYASAPMALAASMNRIPLVLMEQNMRPGLTNRVFQRLARRVCVGFEETAKFFNRTKVEVTGNPVRWQPVDKRSEVNCKRVQILVLGGSSGAHRLNLAVLQAFKILAKTVINWSAMHQTGEVDEEMLRAAYKDCEEARLRVRVVSFLDNVGTAMGEADLIVARAGAMTISEIALAGRAAILVPYPFHKDMQQAHNARVLERLGGAVVLSDDNSLAENLVKLLAELGSDRERLARMGRLARSAARPDAAAQIARICFEIAAPAGGAA